MGGYLLYNCLIVTGENCFPGALAVEGERIGRIWKEGEPDIDIYGKAHPEAARLDLESKVLMAGGIDAHVHFREPGMEEKACIGTESKAAVLGGVTSFIDMPNTNPPTINAAALEDKLDRASESSSANYGFHIGATNGNVHQIKELIYSSGRTGRCPFAGIKVFMGSSTGNMLVDSRRTLEEIFSIRERPVLVHSEDENTIRRNLAAAKERYGDDIPFSLHPAIRSREACIKSTARALDLAIRHRTRLHVLHVSTAEEVEMIREARKDNPLITAETSPNYLWFSDKDYDTMKGRVKCNPAVKTLRDRDALRQAVRDGIIDTIGTDHAPHLLNEKERPYAACPSGLPSIAESLSVLTTIFDRKEDLPLIARIFSENTARIFNIKDRGFLKPGYFADLVVLDPDDFFTLKKEDVSYRCGWSPYEGTTLKGRVKKTFLSGGRPQPLEFLPY